MIWFDWIGLKIFVLTWQVIWKTSNWFELLGSLELFWKRTWFVVFVVLKVFGRGLLCTSQIYCFCWLILKLKDWIRNTKSFAWSVRPKLHSWKVIELVWIDWKVPVFWRTCFCWTCVKIWFLRLRQSEKLWICWS